MNCNTKNKTCPILTILKHKYFKKVIPILFGIIIGYLYYYFIGCSGNSCPITSSPWSTVFVGGIIGFLWTFNKK